MAAPAANNVKNLNGVWTMSKKLSGDTDAILALQGINWFIRKAIGVITVTLIIKQYTDDEGVVHIDITQPGAAGIEGTTELRNLSGEWREHEDHIFGHVKGTTKWIKLEDLKDDDEDEKFLKSGWLPEIHEDGAIDSYVESVSNGWTARQIWGFAEVNNERHHVRRVCVKKGNKTQRQVIVYDYKEDRKD